eukprot:scaffold82505_cov64-Phaeocystis_antarctica.AAC.2
MGAYGALDLLSRCPHAFSATVAIAGAGDPLFAPPLVTDRHSNLTWDPTTDQLIPCLPCVPSGACARVALPRCGRRPGRSQRQPPNAAGAPNPRPEPCTLRALHPTGTAW